MTSRKHPFPVLIADDSRYARALVERALPSDEYAVITADTGEEALRQFAAQRPRVVITDWLMPDVSGIDLCQRIRADFRDSFAYIILLTGVSDKDNLVKGLRAGADDYLTKPFDAGELLARVAVGRRIVELHQEIETKNRLLEQLALTDDLTGLPNRRAVETWAARQINGAMRHSFPFWVVMADLDSFKAINDEYGHDAGDAVLKEFAAILTANTRQSDVCGRLGGDEFVLVLTYAKADGVQRVIERIRERIESHRFTFRGQEVSLTASFGAVALPPGQEVAFPQLLVRADAALYSAKRQGRNRLQLSSAGAA